MKQKRAERQQREQTDRREKHRLTDSQKGWEDAVDTNGESRFAATLEIYRHGFDTATQHVLRRRKWHTHTHAQTQSTYVSCSKAEVLVIRIVLVTIAIQRSTELAGIRRCVYYSLNIHHTVQCPSDGCEGEVEPGRTMEKEGDPDRWPEDEIERNEARLQMSIRLTA